MFQGSSKKVSRLFQVRFRGVSKVFQDRIKVFNGSFKGASRKI